MLGRAVVDRDAPTDPAPSCSEFLLYLSSELQLSPHTVAAYRRDLERLLRGRTALPDRAALLRHLAALRKSHAPASVVRALAAIRGFYRYLAAEGHTDTDPAEGLLGVRLEQRLPPVLGRRAVERLLEFAGDGVEAHALAVRDRTLLHVLYATGARVSELAGLQLGGWDRDRDHLRVIGKGRRAFGS